MNSYFIGTEKQGHVERSRNMNRTDFDLVQSDGILLLYILH